MAPNVNDPHVLGRGSMLGWSFFFFTISMWYLAFNSTSLSYPNILTVISFSDGGWYSSQIQHNTVVLENNPTII